MVNNNSLVDILVVLPTVNTKNGSQYPLVCEGIKGGQWYQPNGTQFPLITKNALGGLGQRNVSGKVELFSGNTTFFPHGVQCCTNTTTTLCVGMYTPVVNSTNDALSVAATCK